ncbi:MULTISPECIES: hypothetical protein [unclassified Caballeronia]|uniref:hypothetical protein n=1 Tax=unclassified Caballeronia TaxID=2646786 RepID=UPI001F3B2EFC|nr:MULTISPECIES: hypothetical protein [unclassified Caballeronia]MCE4543259.1 hypothetical protein [Caballeronia sp. PC1]MCE4567685.1 hypothetical protein [Caballeronia sp. CLC5]
MPYIVYGLFTVAEAGKREYFYVGKTRRAVEIRVREHVYSTLRAQQDVYAFLRKLDAADTMWDWITLRECNEGEHAPDAERIEVIRLLREGHDLRNMRYGDAHHRDELVRQRDTLWIRDVQDIAIDRSIKEALKRKRKSRNLQRRELSRMLRTEGIANVRECRLLSKVIRDRLTVSGQRTRLDGRRATRQT